MPKFLPRTSIGSSPKGRGKAEPKHHHTAVRQRGGAQERSHRGDSKLCNTMWLARAHFSNACGSCEELQQSVMCGWLKVTVCVAAYSAMEPSISIPAWFADEW